MAEEETSSIPIGEFESVSELIASSESLQIAFTILIVGLIIIGVIYHKFSHWIRSQKFNYSRPHVSRFARKAILPFFAIVLVTSTNAYIQSTELFEGEDAFSKGELDPAETFAKILDTINILVIGWTLSHLIPIILTKRDASTLEKEDYSNWVDMQGFPDDDGGLFHKCFKWIPPKTTPYEMEDEEFKKYLETKEGLKFLEKYRTTKGLTIGSYEKLVEDPFDVWKKSERTKYEKFMINYTNYY